RPRRRGRCWLGFWSPPPRLCSTTPAKLFLLVEIFPNPGAAYAPQDLRPKQPLQFPIGSVPFSGCPRSQCEYTQKKLARRGFLRRCRRSMASPLLRKPIRRDRIGFLAPKLTPLPEAINSLPQNPFHETGCPPSWPFDREKSS